jgi:hypothetical protein
MSKADDELEVVSWLIVASAILTMISAVLQWFSD